MRFQTRAPWPLKMTAAACAMAGATATAAADVCGEREADITASLDAEPASSVEPESESDADRWVDGRQPAVTGEVNENSMEATKAWAP